ncbi:energy-coupling factor ABC transporter ATP-binding protein [Microbacterium esteraromaticum]|uniref:energy-coupling factor ABC transporter ATP-binding protein n=1 Tax=Microbacterium esteraromaticum TaxID=57043 RepID=UPI0015F76C8B|nr:ABC transporter ATP-binding protein [Microbacterium esteraromaticum]
MAKKALTPQLIDPATGRSPLAIDVTGAGFVYPTGDVVALSNVDLQVQHGEILGIIGQNGSGKTTLTKLFNGLLKPTSGHVLVDGVITSERTVQQMAAHVGYVFQNPNHQLFARTVTAELEFGPRNIGMTEEEIGERVAHAIEFFGLGDVVDEHPYRVSFPIRKLVGIASVVAMNPSILILDEPSTGQDHDTTHVINTLMRRLRDEGTTVICVSHDMPLLADVVERVIVMKSTQIIADASPREVFADKALMARTNLQAPQVTEIALQTVVPLGGSIALTPDELADDISARLGAVQRTVN